MFVASRTWLKRRIPAGIDALIAARSCSRQTKLAKPNWPASNYEGRRRPIGAKQPWQRWHRLAAWQCEISNLKSGLEHILFESHPHRHLESEGEVTGDQIQMFMVLLSAPLPPPFARLLLHRGVEVDDVGRPERLRDILKSSWQPKTTRKLAVIRRSANEVPRLFTPYRCGSFLRTTGTPTRSARGAMCPRGGHSAPLWLIVHGSETATPKLQRRDTGQSSRMPRRSDVD